MRIDSQSAALLRDVHPPSTCLLLKALRKEAAAGAIPATFVHLGSPQWTAETRRSDDPRVLLEALRSEAILLPHARTPAPSSYGLQ